MKKKKVIANANLVEEGPKALQLGAHTARSSKFGSLDPSVLSLVLTTSCHL
jgi:hypothetical protein